MHLVEELLKEDDPDRRLNFCEVMTEFIKEHLNFVNHIVFSDEATFYLNGTGKNCRYWTNENLHWMVEVHAQHP